jgi:hypothetical protein
MKPEFHEDFISQDVDPTAEPYCDFDWDELYACLGEVREEELELRVKLGLALRRVFRWLLNNNINNKGATEHIGRRAIAFAWVMNPELFEGKSLTQLADVLGLDKQSLSKLSAAVTRKFGIHNRGQGHGWNRKPAASQNARSGPTAHQSKAVQVNTPQPNSERL